MNFFKNCQCIEDVKKLYRNLCMKYHPDISKELNAAETMKQINNEYETAFNKFKDIHKNAKGETYTAKEATTETPEKFKNIIEKLIHFENCKIEIIGSWIWVSGNTKEYKETLKELKSKWCNKKLAWRYHNGKFYKRSKNNLSLNELRDFFGSQEVKTKERLKLAI